MDDDERIAVPRQAPANTNDVIRFTSNGYYRCPVSSPAMGNPVKYNNQFKSTVDSPRDTGIFITQPGQSSPRNQLPVNNHVTKTNLEYYYNDSKQQKKESNSLKNTWVKSLCAQPVEEIMAFYQKRTALQRSRDIWTRAGSTPGERELLRAWRTNSSKKANTKKVSKSVPSRLDIINKDDGMDFPHAMLLFSRSMPEESNTQNSRSHSRLVIKGQRTFAMPISDNSSSRANSSLNNHDDMSQNSNYEQFHRQSPRSMISQKKRGSKLGTGMNNQKRLVRFDDRVSGDIRTISLAINNRSSSAKSGSNPYQPVEDATVHLPQPAMAADVKLPIISYRL